uniref:Alkaline phosphatase, tissue-nonspecific isozyme n=1 Tax=Euprymna scolopes TaxID=6613 RepID=G8H3N9_EUPSC|nr:alkaline phosphatase 2 [Euprymna scolopes]
MRLRTLHALCTLMLFAVGSYAVPTKRLKADWLSVGQEELKESLHAEINENIAKNVIMFLGDGMGISTITAARIYKGQQLNEDAEGFKLSFDKFPHLALIKTYCEDRITPDSAATATAYLSGVKINKGVIGLDSRVAFGQCDDKYEESKVSSILKWSQQKGKSVGIVTTTRVTHATPAGTYAHTPKRDWECDANMPNDTASWCKDIASQLVEDNPDINVILGGGRTKFLPQEMADPEYENKTGERRDHKNLIQTWLKNQQAKKRSAKYVWNQEEFQKVDPKTTDYLFGLFEPSHLQYEMNRETAKNKDPSLSELAVKAVQILQKNKNGFFLLVEGGRIDHGHHNNVAKAALTETVSFDDAIISVQNLVNVEDTLIVVTADHSHVFNLAGYPPRGTNLLDTVPIGEEEKSPLDNKPMTILVYGNGPGYQSPRQNITDVDTTKNTYLQQSAVPRAHETHGGEDLAVFASGPMAHIFRGVREQVFIPTALAYASCVGQNQAHCERMANTAGSKANASLTMIVLSVFLFLHM